MRSPPARRTTRRRPPSASASAARVDARSAAPRRPSAALDPGRRIVGDRSRARPRPDGRSQRLRVPRTRRAARGSSAMSPSPSRQQRNTRRPSQLVRGNRPARSRGRAAGSRARPATGPRPRAPAARWNQPLPATPPPSAPTASVIRSLDAIRAWRASRRRGSRSRSSGELGVRLGGREGAFAHRPSTAGRSARSVMRDALVPLVPRRGDRSGP